MTEKETGRSDRLIQRTNRLKEELEIALKELEDYANVLQEEVGQLREQTKDD